MQFDFVGGDPEVEDQGDRLERLVGDDREGYIGLVVRRCRKKVESEGDWRC